eukprot:207660-Prymnesium_polylepis.1
MRRALQQKEQQVQQLTSEKELLEKLLTSERQAAALQLAQDGREIRRLTNQVQRLEAREARRAAMHGAAEAALQAEVLALRRVLEQQRAIQLAVERRAGAIAGQLQAARDANATDFIKRREAEGRAKRALDAAVKAADDARKAAADAEKRATAAERDQAAAERAAERERQRADAATKRSRAEFMAELERDALAQSASGACSAELEFLAGCVMAT